MANDPTIILRLLIYCHMDLSLVWPQRILSTNLFNFSLNPLMVFEQSCLTPSALQTLDSINISLLRHTIWRDWGWLVIVMVRFIKASHLLCHSDFDLWWNRSFAWQEPSNRVADFHAPNTICLGFELFIKLILLFLMISDNDVVANMIQRHLVIFQLSLGIQSSLYPSFFLKKPKSISRWLKGREKALAKCRLIQQSRSNRRKCWLSNIIKKVSNPLHCLLKSNNIRALEEKRKNIGNIFFNQI